MIEMKCSDRLLQFLQSTSVQNLVETVLASDTLSSLLPKEVLATISKIEDYYLQPADPPHAVEVSQLVDTLIAISKTPALNNDCTSTLLDLVKCGKDKFIQMLESEAFERLWNTLESIPHLLADLSQADKNIIDAVGHWLVQSTPNPEFATALHLVLVGLASSNLLAFSKVHLATLEQLKMS